jgi:transcription antitermination factor NusG
MGVRDAQWPWFAIQVRTWTEKTANLHLENAGYETFLPFAKFAHRWFDRMGELEVPLFPGCFFCRMNPNHRLPVLQSPGVIQIVGVGEKAIPVEGEEIAAIRRVTKSGLSIVPWPYLRVGRVARVEQGPLRGLTGIVVKIKAGMKLVLSVSLLQRSVAVEIDRTWIGAVAARPALIRPQRGMRARLPIDSARLQVAQNLAVSKQLRRTDLAQRIATLSKSPL